MYYLPTGSAIRDMWLSCAVRWLIALSCVTCAVIDQNEATDSEYIHQLVCSTVAAALHAFVFTIDTSRVSGTAGVARIFGAPVVALFLQVVARVFCFIIFQEKLL